MPEDPAEDKGHSPSEIKEVLERAIRDQDFKNLLLKDPDAALADYELTEVQILLIRSLDRQDLAKLTPENLDEYFSVDAAVYTPDDAAEVQRGHEVYESSNFEEREP